MSLIAMLLMGVGSTGMGIYLIGQLFKHIELTKRLSKLVITNKYRVMTNDKEWTYSHIICYLSTRGDSQKLLTYSDILDWIMFKLPDVDPRTITIVLHKKTSFKMQPIVKFAIKDTKENDKLLSSLGFEHIEEEYLPWNETKKEKISGNQY